MALALETASTGSAVMTAFWTVRVRGWRRLGVGELCEIGRREVSEGLVGHLFLATSFIHVSTNNVRAASARSAVRRDQGHSGNGQSASGRAVAEDRLLPVGGHRMASGSYSEGAVEESENDSGVRRFFSERCAREERWFLSIPSARSASCGTAQGGLGLDDGDCVGVMAIV